MENSLNEELNQLRIELEGTYLSIIFLLIDLFLESKQQLQKAQEENSQEISKLNQENERKIEEINKKLSDSEGTINNLQEENSKEISKWKESTYELEQKLEELNKSHKGINSKFF